MKKILFLTVMMAATLCISAKNAAKARKVLDKTAAIVGSKGGASANFKASSPKMDNVSGKISVKGNKFQATAGEAIIWFDGKTQWSYLKSTNEVNVTTPTEAQRMRMNPYTFITMYKEGYTLSMTQKGTDYQIHMVARNKQRTVQEVYLTINRTSYKPSLIKMREGQTWTTISISNFQAKNLPNSAFTFNAKDFPSAEVIDLR